MSLQPVLIDNNALADLFVGESQLQADAERLRRAFPVWVAPPLIRYEFGNVLRTAVRLGRQEESTALTMLRKGLGMIRLCGEPSEENILRAANGSGLTFYDATYVASARELGLTLYTRDKEILKNCPDVARRIADT